MVNLTKLESELKEITGYILSISAKVNQKWAPSGEFSIFVDAEGDSVGLSYSEKLDSFVLSKIEQAVLAHSKESTNDQKLEKIAENISKKTISAMLCALSALSNKEKIPEWAADIINSEAQKLPNLGG